MDEDVDVSGLNPGECRMPAPNLLEIVDAGVDPRGAPPVRLREIDINVTNLCNLECIYCSYSSTPGKDEPELARSRLLQVLDEAAALGTRVIHFSGGEPVIRPDMPEIIAHAAALGFKMRMHSNGALLSKARLQLLWDAGLRQVLISLDGFEADHEFHRAKPGLYPRTLKGIENAASMGFNVRVNAVATSRNVDRIPQLVPLADRMGAATLSVFYLIPVGRGRDVRDLMVPPARWRQVIAGMRQAADACRPERMEVTVEKVFLWEEEEPAAGEADGGRGQGCLGFLRRCDYVNILADGRVYPCVCFLDVAPPLGNVYDRPLAEILHDPRSWGFYWRLTRANATCASCERLGACGGGSKALSKTLLDDWLALDPRCSGDPAAQGFIPLCFMCRESVTTGTRSGFAEKVG